MGGARSLARDVCQGIRSVLADGASPTVTVSRRAQAALQALTDEIPVSSGTHFVMSRSDGAPMHTWTFAGTRANRGRHGGDPVEQCASDELNREAQAK